MTNSTNETNPQTATTTKTTSRRGNRVQFDPFAPTNVERLTNDLVDTTLEVSGSIRQAAKLINSELTHFNEIRRMDHELDLLKAQAVYDSTKQSLMEDIKE